MSPYFPHARERQPYQCPGCKGWFYAGSFSCCVAHSPGTCCHEYEQRASPPMEFKRPDDLTASEKANTRKGASSGAR